MITLGKHSQHWLNRSHRHVWQACTQMKHHETLPIIPIERGKGSWLFDFDGRRYLDAISSWWVNLFGHAHPKIAAAIAEQALDLEHVLLAGFTHKNVIELSERLAALSHLPHAFYASDGASATEIALKMSAHSWKNQGFSNKNRFVHLQNSYHGETLGALSVTDIPLFRNTYGELLSAHLSTPSPVPYTHETPQVAAKRAAQALETLFTNHHHTIAALIVEPLVQGAAGMKMYDPEFLSLAKTLCERFQIHFIADEIAVGFGRTGKLFAHQHAHIQPDFLCLSKGITGGFLPLSVVLTQQDIFDSFYDEDTARGFLHSHSYTGNALACRAALAVLDIFESEQILEHNAKKIERFTQFMQPLKQHPRVQNFRQCGMIWAFEVATAQAGFAQEFFAAMLKRECLIRPIGNTVYFMPPYCFSEDEMTFLITQTLDALEHLNTHMPKTNPHSPLALP